MERFWQIKSKKNDSNFFSMVEFNNAIKKKKSNDQRLFSPFKESLDLLSKAIKNKYVILTF